MVPFCHGLHADLQVLVFSTMNASVKHIGALQFEIKVRHHVLFSDQPVEDGGFDEGMTPPELLLAALGSCAAYYAAQYLRKQRVAKEGTSVTVDAEKALNPPRLDNFRIRVRSPVALNDAQRAGLRDAISHCLVHNTLTHPPQIRLELGENED